MDSSNHWYGHANVLARYCGLDSARPPRINGVVQHGWNFVHGFGYGHRPPWGFAKFVWSDVCRRRGHAIGWRDYYVIGAPFLYAMSMEQSDAVAEDRAGTIWYPFHGTADYEPLFGDHRRLAEQIRATEPGPVTVCLYYVEYDDATIRSTYERAGFRVITHGRRGVKWKGGTSDFVYRQLQELRRHRRVASNRLSTAVFYGIAAGCEPAVYGDPMELVGVKDGYNGEDLLEARFPELHGEVLDLATSVEIADQELGRRWVLPSAELACVLGWQRTSGRTGVIE